MEKNFTDIVSIKYAVQRYAVYENKYYKFKFNGKKYRYDYNAYMYQKRLLWIFWIETDDID
jgi:hypothetical protein